MTKLTLRQAEMLAELVASPAGRVVFPTRNNQDKRTAYSLQRKGLCIVKVLTKMPGLRFSYGYRAVELTRSYHTPSMCEADMSIDVVTGVTRVQP